MRNLIICTKGLAPYRVSLYEKVAEALEGDFQCHLITPSGTAEDHAWSKMGSADSILNQHFVAGKKVGKGGNTGFRTLGTISSVLPSHSLWEKISGLKPSLIWIHEYSPYVLTAYFYGFLRRVPIVVSSDMGIHSVSDAMPRAIQKLHAILGKAAKGQIANTSAAKEPYSKIENVLFAPHAIDCESYCVSESPIGDRDPARKLTGIYVGNLIPRKGIDLLFQAIARLSDQAKSRVRFNLFGGEGEIDYPEMAKELGIGENIEFCGFKEGEDLRKAYAEADFFVLPCRLDTYGVVTHEAAACGLPLLVSQFAGSAETLVLNSGAGEVFDPTDLDSFAETLERWILNPAVFDEYSKNARAVAEEYCVRKSAARISKWLKEIEAENG